MSNDDERGAALIEFLFTSLIWLPLLLGTTVFGINLIRAIQVSQLARDSGHMYAYGIDFKQSQNSALLSHLASPLDIPASGAVLLSRITFITPETCATVKKCVNGGKYVFTDLVSFGNLQYAKSQLGTPPQRYYGQNLTTEYYTDANLVAPQFSSLLSLPPGQYAYISEVTVNSQALSWADFSNTGPYARSIF